MPPGSTSWPAAAPIRRPLNFSDDMSGLYISTPLRSTLTFAVYCCGQRVATCYALSVFRGVPFYDARIQHSNHSIRLLPPRLLTSASSMNGCVNVLVLEYRSLELDVVSSCGFRLMSRVGQTMATTAAVFVVLQPAGQTAFLVYVAGCVRLHIARRLCTLPTLLHPHQGSALYDFCRGSAMVYPWYTMASQRHPMASH